jgi:hypothetical protein
MGSVASLTTHRPRRQKEVLTALRVLGTELVGRGKALKALGLPGLEAAAQGLAACKKGGIERSLAALLAALPSSVPGGGESSAGPTVLTPT